MPRGWSGVRAHPDENPVVLMRQVLNCKMSPRLRQVLELALEMDGSLDKAAVTFGISPAAMRKEMNNLRATLVEVGLARSPKA